MLNPEMLALAATGEAATVHGRYASLHAIVHDGVVINVTRWDPDEHEDWSPHKGDAVPCDETVAIGHLWDGQRFTDPTPPSVPEPKRAKVVEFSAAMPADVREEMKARLNEFEQRVQDTLAERMGSDPAGDDRLQRVEQTVGSLVDASHAMIDAMNTKFDDIAGKLAAAEAWMLVIEAQSDPAPTLANHPQAGQLLGMTPAQDGDAEAWGAAIKAAKEKRS